MHRHHPRIALLLVFALACVCLAWAPGAVADSPAAGPRLVFFEVEYVSKKKQPKTEPPVLGGYISTDPRGRDPRTFDTPASVETALLPFDWSGDGSEYAFVAGRPRRAFVARSDGTGSRPVAGTKGTSVAVLSPDGEWLAFDRDRLYQPKVDWKDPKSAAEALRKGYETRSTWIVPTAGGRPRRLTPWGRRHSALPTAFSPDGSTLLVDEDGGPAAEVDAIDLATGTRSTVELQASEATYSPDGSRIAFISYRDHESVPGFDEPEATSEIYVAAADGTGARRVTHTPKLEETSPSWDPSGERLAYLRSPGGMFGFLFGRVAESSPDGDCTKVLPASPVRRKGGHKLIGAPSWWPGPGRGAGPLSC